MFEKIKKNIDREEKSYFDVSSLLYDTTELDPPWCITNDMVKKSIGNGRYIDGRILIPNYKFGRFLISILENKKYNEFFKVDDQIRIELSKIYITVKSRTVRRRIEKHINFLTKNKTKRSKIITDFYEQLHNIFIYNNEYKNLLDIIFLNFFTKTNSKELSNIEKEIEELVLSKEYQSWIDLCKRQIKDYTNLDKICSREFAEIFSPDWLIKAMIKLLPKATIHSKYLDNAAGIFNYGIYLVEKLMNDLEFDIPDEEERKKWILENMIYQVELQVKNTFINYFILDPENKYDTKLFRGSFLTEDYKNINPDFLNWLRQFGYKDGEDFFDDTITNPPYMIKMMGGSDKPIYNHFVINSLKISKRVSMITPSRWYVTGKGLDSYRKMMLNRNDIVYMRHFDNDQRVFGSNVDLPGGVSYFLIDKNYNGKCTFHYFDEKLDINFKKYDILIKDVKYYTLIDKVKDLPSIENKCVGQSFAGITTNDNRITNNKVDENFIKCYVSKNKGYIKWINKDNIKKESNYEKFWKVVTAEANGEYPRFGNMFIAKPNEIFSQSYVAFLFDSEEEAKSCKSYLQTDFANKLLSLRKITQHIKPSTCKWIPIVPFDREWTDEKIIEYFQLSKNIKKLIYE